MSFSSNRHSSISKITKRKFPRKITNKKEIQRTRLKRNKTRMTKMKMKMKRTMSKKMRKRKRTTKKTKRRTKARVQLNRVVHLLKRRNKSNNRLKSNSIQSDIAKTLNKEKKELKKLISSENHSF